MARRENTAAKTEHTDYCHKRSTTNKTNCKRLVKGLVVIRRLVSMPVGWEFVWKLTKPAVLRATFTAVFFFYFLPLTDVLCEKPNNGSEYGKKTNKQTKRQKKNAKNRMRIWQNIEQSDKWQVTRMKKHSRTKTHQVTTENTQSYAHITITFFHFYINYYK